GAPAARPGGLRAPGPQLPRAGQGGARHAGRDSARHRASPAPADPRIRAPSGLGGTRPARPGRGRPCVSGGTTVPGDASRFGVFLPSYIWDGDGSSRVSGLLDFAREVERLGFDSIFITDHIIAAKHFYDVSWLD